MERLNNIFKYAVWKPDSISTLASSLRNGMKCTCDPRQVPAGGSFNWAVFFVFEDGQEWVLRSPFDKQRNTIAVALAGSLLKSEVATLKYLKRYTDIPVPTVHSFSPTAANPAGIPYILMDKAPGRPLNAVWSNGEARDKVLRQLGRYTWQLAQHRFDQIGSLFSPVEDTFVVGKCLSRGHVLNQRHVPGRIDGPFKTTTEYWESLFAAFREQAECLALNGAHCFMAPKVQSLDYEKGAHFRRADQLRDDFLAIGQKRDSADNRVDYLIASAIAQGRLKEWLHTNPATTLSKPFALQHPDLSVNNIFVDDAFNITCIIDWEFCTTVPLEMLFSPPGFPQSRNPMAEHLIHKFQQGLKLAAMNAGLCGMRGESGSEVELTLANLRLSSLDTQKARDKAAIVRNTDRLLDAGRFFWPLIRLINFDSTDDHMLLVALWERIPSSDGMSLAAPFSQCRASPQNRSLWRALRRTDLSEERVQMLEKENFRRRAKENRVVDLAIARKLTVVSDWRTQYTRTSGAGIRDGGELFVANAKLWKWVLKWEEEYWELYG